MGSSATPPRPRRPTTITSASTSSATLVMTLAGRPSSITVRQLTQASRAGFVHSSCSKRWPKPSPRTTSSSRRSPRRTLAPTRASLGSSTRSRPWTSRFGRRMKPLSGTGPPSRRERRPSRSAVPGSGALPRSCLSSGHIAPIWRPQSRSKLSSRRQRASSMRFGVRTERPSRAAPSPSGRPSFTLWAGTGFSRSSGRPKERFDLRMAGAPDHTESEPKS